MQPFRAPHRILPIHEAFGDDHEGAPLYRLTPKIIADTFRFSQGRRSLQAHLFSVLLHRHPDLVRAPLETDLLVAACLPALLAHTTNNPNHVEITPDEVEQELKTVLSMFTRQRGAMMERGAPRYSALVSQFLTEVMTADVAYLEKNGRTRTPVPGGGRRNPQRDPWLSHLCYYGLLAQPTGNPDFDVFFTDVATFARYVYLVEPTSTRAEDLGFLIGLWNGHHPDVPLDERTLLPGYRFLRTRPACPYPGFPLP